MPCDCPGCPNLFSDKAAADDLASYRRSGPDSTTRRLIRAIVAEGIEGSHVLDIGGGVGAIQLELLDAGAASTESVDASAPYVAVARAEAERRGFGDRTVHRAGDFVALADEVAPADVVTLVRMICCYSDMPRLVGTSIGHARRMIGLVYPRDTLWVRAFARIMNLGEWLIRRPIRWYIHREAAVDGLLMAAGFERRMLDRGLLWQVALYVRGGSA